MCWSGSSQCLKEWLSFPEQKQRMWAWRWRRRKKDLREKLREATETGGLWVGDGIGPPPLSLGRPHCFCIRKRPRKALSQFSGDWLKLTVLPNTWCFMPVWGFIWTWSGESGARQTLQVMTFYSDWSRQAPTLGWFVHLCINSLYLIFCLHLPPCSAAQMHV